jgi:hypothetical protein
MLRAKLHAQGLLDHQRSLSLASNLILHMELIVVEEAITAHSAHKPGLPPIVVKCGVVPLGFLPKMRGPAHIDQIERQLTVAEKT